MYEPVQSAEADSDYKSDFEGDGDEMEDIMEKIFKKMTYTKDVTHISSKNRV